LPGSLARAVLLCFAASPVPAEGIPGSVVPGSAAGPPNILFLLADDQRADTIAAWGNSSIKTPHLDDLVRRGFSFRRNYCFGSDAGAVCVPSRAMLMTGRTWLHVGHDMAGVKLLPELLRENGYTTFATGKWHNGEPSFQRAFERGEAVFFGGMADHNRVPVADLAGGKLVNRRHAEKFSSELFADAAIAFLRGDREPKPFFLYVAFTASHDPRNPPASFREMYYRDPPPLPRNFLPQHPFDNGWTTGRDEDLAPWPRTEAVVRDQLAEYYGLITHLDGEVGRILAALEASGRGRDTIIIYAADHGLALGSHGLLGKQSLYEHSMRAPLVVVGPGIPAGGSTRALTYLHDLFPTLCDLTGAAPPAGLEGKSLKSLWSGKVARVRDSLTLAFGGVMRAVRDERWKLIVYPRIDHRQLFDIESDPDELRDLAADPAHAQRLERLTALLRDWQQQAGDKQPLRAERPKPKEIDLRGRKREPDQWQPAWIREKYFGGGGR
jgi:arylsulfatase A-like enzyme